jgi:hypothetical protein
VELEAPGTGVVSRRVRLENGATVGDWFAWGSVGADAIQAPACGAGLGVGERWCDEGRWFAALEAP